MKSIIIVAVFVFILFLARTGYILFKKGKDAEKLEYSLFKSDTPNLTVEQIVKIIDGKDTNPVLIEVIEQIKNPTNSEYLIDQMNLNILTPSGKFVVKQKEPLAKAFTIHKKSENNYLKLNFLLNPKGLEELVREAGGVIQIGSNKLRTGEWGINFRIKGTISTEGFELDLDETITI